MSKKIAFWVVLAFASLSLSFTSANFTSSQTTTLLNAIYKKVDKIAQINSEKLLIIQERIVILKTKTNNTELKNILEKIYQYIVKTLINTEFNVVDANQATVGIQTLTKGLRPMYENLGSFYLLRVKPEVTGIPKNLVIQTYIHHGYCLELPKDNLPLDFTYISTDGGKTRSSIKDRPAALGVQYVKDGITYTAPNKITCGAFHLKVLFPEEWTLFDAGLAFPILNRGHEYPENRRCIDMTISADNAQYQEYTYCW